MTATFTDVQNSLRAPFKVRSFRFQWPADLAASLAFEMEILVLGWYVLVESGSVMIFPDDGLPYFTACLFKHRAVYTIRKEL